MKFTPSVSSRRATRLFLGDRQMKTYQYKPDAQASAFIRHAENTCTRLRVGRVLAVSPVGFLLPFAKEDNQTEIVPRLS